MDAIKTYIDNVFAAFPRTERVLALKSEMLAGLEEKYHALKQEGKSEHEAVGGVIANFGSIDEIAAELGIEQGAAAPDDSVHVSREQARDYLEQTRKSGFWIGLGVWLILAGVSALLMVNGESGVFQAGKAADAIGVLLLFLTIAAAVPIFIVSGMRLKQSRYEIYQKHNLGLDAQTRAELEQQSARFMTRFTVHIAAGVAVILLAVGSLFALYEFAGMDGEALPAALLMFMIGFAVFLFITAGMLKSAYDILLGKGDYIDKARNSKAERIIGTAASVYWPFVVAIYLLWSFLSGAWDRSWLIWPVAGLLFGALSGGISTWLGTKN